jgi:hypothetical protein
MHRHTDTQTLNMKFNLFNSSKKKLENLGLGPLSLRISAYRDRDGNLRRWLRYKVGRGSNINSGGLGGRGRRGGGRIRHRNVRNHIGNISHNIRTSDWGRGILGYYLRGLQGQLDILAAFD